MKPQRLCGTVELWNCGTDQPFNKGRDNRFYQAGPPFTGLNSANFFLLSASLDTGSYKNQGEKLEEDLHIFLKASAT